MALPTTDLELVNMALAKIGHTTAVANLSTDQTPEAVAARQFLDPCRERAFQYHGAKKGETGWRWASKQAVLVAAAGQTDERWEYFYTPPTDMVPNTGWLWAGIPDPPPDTLAEFQVILNAAGSGKVIACNLPPVAGVSPIFVYTKLVTTVTLYPMSFVEFFTWLLAADLAMPVTRDLARRDRALLEAQYALAVAVAAEGRGSQGYPEPYTLSRRARG